MRPLFLIAGVLLSQTAFAQPSLSQIDLYYGVSEIDSQGGPTLEGRAVGLRGWIGRSWPIVTGEYERGEVDNAGQEVDVEFLRGGLGIRLLETELLSAWIRAEYLQMDFSSGLEDEGFSGFAGLRVGNAQLSGYGEVGAIEADDVSGTEFRVGLSYEPANYGFFLEYRGMTLEPDVGADADLTDARLGLRWRF